MIRMTTAILTATLLTTTLILIGGVATAQERESGGTYNWRSGSGGASEAVPYIQKGYAIVESVDRSAKTLWLHGYLYRVTNETEFLNEVGQRASMREVEAMQVINGEPDPDTGTPVYFEADAGQGLLKLHLLEAMPS